MPEIKIKHIVSFSSEDKVHKAENILKSETYRKWKCATPGEKNASIVLQFEKASQIHSIDIGNESSAFVEVLVGRSSDTVNDFQVLLVASSFMSPLESRNETHNNRVRMFGPDKLAQNLKDEKWDCVQIVCTQPFNKNITYGLSFIKFHSPPEKPTELPPSEKEAKKAPARIGAFKLKYDDDEEEDIDSSPPIGSWFERMNKNVIDSAKTLSSEAPSYAAAVLASNSSPSTSSNDCESEYEKIARKNKEQRLALLQALKIEEIKESLSNSVQSLKTMRIHVKRPPPPAREKSRRLVETKMSPSQNSPIIGDYKVPSQKRKMDSNKDSNAPPAKKEVSVPSNQRRITSSKDFSQPSSSNFNSKTSDNSNTNNKRKADVKRPFGKLMEKVVFVISGFVNPNRSEIRDKALEMGAKYKGDWDKTCTHLICAFVNTPKYNQVKKAGGRIVTKDWILDCHKKRVLLPWQNYMLGTYSFDTSDSEEEDMPIQRKNTKNRPQLNGGAPSSKDLKNNTNSNLKDRPNSSGVLSEALGKKGKASPTKGSPKKKVSKDSDLSMQSSSETECEDAIQDYLADTDVESDSGGNTEDEILKVEKQTKRKVLQKSKPSSSRKSEEEEEETEEDSDSLLGGKPDTKDLPLPDLPNFFKKRHFYFYGDFLPKKHHDLRRYITAYNGVIDDYMSDSTKYVLTESKWDKNFDEALNENEDLIFVKPEWIFKCYEAQKLVPYQPYIIIPKS